MAILEAMASGTPLVSTIEAGSPEAVIDLVTGFLLPERDCSGMASGIVALAAVYSLRAQMGGLKWERVMAKLSWTVERPSLLELMGLCSEDDRELLTQ